MSDFKMSGEDKKIEINFGLWVPTIGFMIICFTGEPDLIDAIIMYLVAGSLL